MTRIETAYPFLFADMISIDIVLSNLVGAGVDLNDVLDAACMIICHNQLLNTEENPLMRKCRSELLVI